VKTFFNSIRNTITEVQLTRETGNKVAWKPFIILFVASSSLILIEYLGKSPGHYLMQKLATQAGLNRFAAFLQYNMQESPDRQLYQLAYWVSIIFICYFIIPALVIRFGFRERLRDYGLQWGSFLKDSWVYLVMLGIMFPLVYFASRTHSFQARYPFYTPANGESLWPNFWIWQMIYFVQFFALEFFFRGFMVHGLKKYAGFYSVIIMTVPYCMIHFGKPMGETFAAIFAGIALGTMSLKSRSIALGVFLHYSVAITMDMAALWQEGFFQ
jgi:hypothetical protein